MCKKLVLTATLALFLVAVAPQARADEGVATINLQSAVLVPVEGPPVNVTGGVWLSDEQALRVADRLREAGGLPPLSPGPTSGSWLVPLVVGLGVGLLGGITLAVNL